jgi:hypothetical protein
MPNTFTTTGGTTHATTVTGLVDGGIWDSPGTWADLQKDDGVRCNKDVLQVDALGLVNGHTAGLHRQVGHFADDVGHNSKIVLLGDARDGVLDRGVVRPSRDVYLVETLAGGPQVLNRFV